MLVEIILCVTFLYPSVLGQSAEFEQECHVLRTLEIIETRLQEQAARLKLQETLIEEQSSRLDKQDFLLENQTATLEQQEAHIFELEAQLNATRQTTDDQRIGFSVRTPADAEKSNVIRFTDIDTNEGEGYNSSTGEFTCSMPGLYSFSIHLIKHFYSSTKRISCYFYINDDAVALAMAILEPMIITAGMHYEIYGASTSAVVQMSTGDVVYPGSCSTASTMNSWSSFSGFLIRAD